MRGPILLNGALLLAGMVAVAALASRLLPRPAAQASAELRPLDTTAPVTYFIEDGTRKPGVRGADRELATWAFEAWDRSAGGRFRFRPAAEADAIVRVHWADAGDGFYGEMRQLTVEGRPGAAVYIQADMAGLGDGIARRAKTDDLFRDTIVYLTCVHELGHALGLSHTSDFGDIMYFFGYGGDIREFFGRYRTHLRARRDIAGVSGISAGDVQKLRALYPAN
jgi:hypothetical protein